MFSSTPLQVVIFVKSVQRCVALAQLLIEQNFPAIAIHRGMSQEERLSRWVCRLFGILRFCYSVMSIPIDPSDRTEANITLLTHIQSILSFVI